MSLSRLEFGRTGGPRPVQDENKLDLNQLFIEFWTPSQCDQPSVSLKIGRQELQYGEGALLDMRDLNVRRSFDGLKFVVRTKDWRIDLFGMKPDLSQPGHFADYPDHTQTLWGAYGITAKHLAKSAHSQVFSLTITAVGAHFGIPIIPRIIVAVGTIEPRRTNRSRSRLRGDWNSLIHFLEARFGITSCLPTMRKLFINTAALERIQKSPNPSRALRAQDIACFHVLGADADTNKARPEPTQKRSVFQ